MGYISEKTEQLQVHSLERSKKVACSVQEIFRGHFSKPIFSQLKNLDRSIFFSNTGVKSVLDGKNSNAA